MLRVSLEREVFECEKELEKLHNKQTEMITKRIRGEISKAEHDLTDQMKRIGQKRKIAEDKLVPIVKRVDTTLN